MNKLKNINFSDRNLSVIVDYGILQAKVTLPNLDKNIDSQRVFWGNELKKTLLLSQGTFWTSENAFEFDLLPGFWEKPEKLLIVLALCNAYTDRVHLYSGYISSLSYKFINRIYNMTIANEAFKDVNEAFKDVDVTTIVNYLED